MTAAPSRTRRRLLMRRLLGVLFCAFGFLALVACGGASRQARATATGAGATTGAVAAPVARAVRSVPVGTASSATARPSKPAGSHSGSTGASAALNRALASFAACLSSHGVKLPAHTGSAPSLKGVDTSTASYRRARAACIPVVAAALKVAAKLPRALAAPATRPAPAAASTVKVPASVTAIMTRFTTCMRAHGVPGFPQPTGASFDMSGTHMDTHSASYKSAEAQCTSILQALDQTG